MVLALFWGSCEMINPEEKVPTYVHIDSFKFNPTPNTGTASQDITTVWAYFEGRLVGSFDLPATFPVIADEPGLLQLRAGVVYSGIKNVLVPYPHFTIDTFTLHPSPGNMVTVTPQVQYYSDTVINFLNEDFELLNGFTKVVGDTGVVRTNNPDYVFEGVYSGAIFFENDSLSENVMTQSFTAPIANSFVELNYKSTLHFDVGLQSTTNNGTAFVQYIFTYRPNSEWTKIYIGLQDFISQYPNRSYRLAVRVHTPNRTDGYVLLDNVKIVTP